MRGLMFFLAALTAIALIGLPKMNANAQMSNTLAAIKPAPKNYTPLPIEKAACGPFWGAHCGPFHHWVCGPYGRRCWCAPC